MKRIGLLHNTLNSVGGAERFTLELIKILRKHGYFVNLATFDRTDWSRLKQLYGEDLTLPNRSFSIIPRRLPFLGVYQRLLPAFAVRRLTSQSDIVINTHSDHLFCPADIVYLHGVAPELGFGLSLKEQESPPWNFNTIRKTMGGFSTWKRVYVLPYRILAHCALRHFNMRKATYIANSRFTAQGLRNLHGIEANRIIYPPVQVEKYRPSSFHTQRENLVVTVARFAPEKKLEILPHIIQKTRKDIRFALIGHSNTALDRPVEAGLRRRRTELGVEDRFQIIRSSPSVKMDMLTRGKVYLHTSWLEAFGISLVEAVSSGLIPVAVNRGGHMEIMDEVKPKLTYGSVDEAAELIEKAVDLWNPALATENSRRMEKFSCERFEKEIMEVIEHELGRRTRPKGS